MTVPALHWNVKTVKCGVYKAKGKVSNLEASCMGRDVRGSLGIAHTRWATHGEPNDRNAHPQVSQSGALALVHNGTIENYAVLKAALSRHGYTFVSETDTEVLVQLIEYVKTTNGCDLVSAVARSPQTKLWVHMLLL